MHARRRKAWVLGGALLFACTGNAYAQNSPALTDKRMGDGDGLRSGSFELHPSIGVRAGYDSNVLRRAGTDEEPKAAAMRIMITPALRFSMAPLEGEGGRTQRRKFELSGLASATYNEFVPLDSTGDGLAGNRNVGALANVNLDISPGAKWSGGLHAGYSRTIQPSNIIGVDQSLNRSVPTAGAVLNWRPGGGLLTWSLTYDFAYTLFEGSTFNNLNNMSHTIGTRGNWRFLPRTSLFFDSSVRLLRYNDADTITVANGDWISGNLGIQGLATNSFGFLVKAGWVGTVYDAKPGAQAQDFDSPTGQAEARFYLTHPVNPEQTKNYPTMFAIGYQRSVQQSYIGNFFRQDEGYLRLEYFLTRKIVSNSRIGVASLGFPQSNFASGALRNESFSALMLVARTFVEYRLTPNLGINGSISYQSLITDKRLPGDDSQTVDNPVVGDDIKWDRLQAILGVRYFY